MSDVITFQDVDKKFTLTTKKEFLEKCPTPEKETAYDLNAKFYMLRYLHNPHGPAVVRHKDNRLSFWLDGVCLEAEDPEKALKIEHDSKFKDKVNTLINE